MCIRDRPSFMSQYDTDRQDTQHILLDKVAIHRYNPSNLPFKVSCFINQKENGVSLQSAGRGTCSLLSTSPVLAALKAPMKKALEWQRNEVSLIRKGLSKLPCHLISRYTRLEVLDLRDNEFTQFPEEVLHLGSLAALRLDGNCIRTIPHSITKLSLLKTFTVSKNKIQCLTPSMAKLQTLVTLSVNENKDLKEWPVWLGDLPRLRVLHMQGNRRIASIPASLGQMENLIELGFDWLCYVLPSHKKVAVREDKVLEQLKELCREAKCKCLNFKMFKDSFIKEEKFDKGRTVLHMAAMWNHTGVIKEMADKSINDKDSLGHSPLILALKYNKLEAVELMLKCPYIKVSEYDQKHGSALHLAVLKSLWSLSKRVIHHPTFNPNTQDDKGNTALHLLFSIFERDPAAVEEVCEEVMKCSGCNVNVRNSCGLAPIHCAVAKDQRHAVSFFLKVNKTQRSRFDLSATAGEKNSSILHFLVTNLNIEGIVDALNTGVNVFATDALGRTARDLVSNAMIARLLKRYESSARAHAFAAETGSSTGRSTSSNVKVCNHTAINRSSLRTHEEAMMLEMNKETIIEPIRVIKFNRPLAIEAAAKSTIDRKSAVESNQSPVNDQSFVRVNPTRYSRLSGSMAGERNLKPLAKEMDVAEKSTADETMIFKLAAGNELDKAFASKFIINAPARTQLLYIYHLFKENVEDAEGLLSLVYEKSASKSVRMNAINLLSIIKSKKNSSALSAKSSDLSSYYELVNGKVEGSYVRQHLRNITETNVCEAKGNIAAGADKTMRNLNSFNRTIGVKKAGVMIGRKTLSYFNN
eukprot:TRINITY_DN2112_c0_g1_i12.p1 TRINITY_DN2112_c0_g1~~TRINITY_DN2112_c0_g1_i12.p1  ORF type:complete len:811 (+),score=152.51 TRINITY_DN2112_c0_g1_i12:81-2513(+)